MITHKSLLVFDIETIPDTEAGKNLLRMSNQSEEEIASKMHDYHLEITGNKNSFLRQLFHKVISISWILAKISSSDNEKENIEFTEIGYKDISSGNEKELISFFFNKIQENRSRLVSFNGRMFDIPVLKYKALKYGIQADFFYNSGDKWNNYNQRYSSNWHCDLCEVLSDFGMSAKVKLDEVCALLNIPGKLDVSGDSVFNMYLANQINEISEYCECDTLSTYLVYLKYLLHTAKINQHNYIQETTKIIQMLANNKNKKNYQTFYNRWASINPNISEFL